MHRRLKKGNHLWLGVVMGTTDADVARHCQRIAGGTVTGPYPTSRYLGVATYKPTWKWGVNRHRECVALMEELRPLMSQRRQAQIDSCLEAWANKTEVRNTDRTHCPHGHPYDEANTYLYHGHRLCRACNRRRGQELRARRAAKS